MEENLVTTTVYLLGKEYRIICPEHEQAGLQAAVDYLDARMQEIRDRGKVIGSERIALIAAINIAHELLQYRTQTEENAQLVSHQIQALQEKIDAALSKERVMVADEY